MIVACTGHRPNKLGGYDDATASRLRRFAGVIIAGEYFGQEYGFRVITGMALGWDTAVAQACLAMNIPYTAAVPFEGQESKWPLESQREYTRLLNSAAEIVITSNDGYSILAMDTRNKWMVDNCTSLLSLWDGSAGGTANCNRYAKGKVPVTQLWDKWMEFKGRNVNAHR